MSSFSEKDLLSITESPGAQYAFFNTDKVLQQLYAGYSDVVRKISVTAETTFNAYSTTKTFTAAAILKLVEQDKLTLDAEVNPLLLQFAFSGKFTVRQLLSHQAGIANPLPISWVHLADETFDEKTFNTQLMSKNLKLRFIPGSKMSYSNVGYIILGLLIEQASGTDYKTFVTEHLLKPAISNGHISYTLSPIRHATGYHPKFSFSNLLLRLMLDKKKFMQPATGGWSAFRNHYVNGSPYGGLIANAQGMMEYLQALLLRKVLTEASLAQFFTVQRDNMCLCWYKGRLGNLDYFCHAGGGGGYYCEIRLYPQLNSGSVLMTNRSGFTDQRLLDKIDSYFIS